MAIYWLIFLLFALLALVSKRSLPLPNGRFDRSFKNWSFTLVPFLILFIGFRGEVGGDWGSYKWGFINQLELSFAQKFVPTGQIPDPGFVVLQHLMGEMGFTFVSVNVASSLFFVIGLLKFCKALPRPYLALAVAFPYMIVVVSMGYMRQSIALGIVMYAIEFLITKKNTKFFIYVMLAATFHKSAVLFFPLAIFVSTKNRFFIFIGAILLAAVGYVTFIETSVERIARYYIGQEYSSSGAIYRVGMLVVPSILFLIFKKHFNLVINEQKLWTIFALTSFPLLVAVLFLNISTTVDRIALYALPIQLFLFSYLPDAFKKSSQLIILFIVIYYAVVMFVWLNYATHSCSWIPYTNELIGYKRVWTC